MMIRMHGFLLWFASGLAIALPASAQNSSQGIVVGERYRIESSILDETRSLLIATPEGYGRGNQRYGVLYVLDGDVHFQHTAASANFLSHPVTLRIPELIVVAVINSDRRRDFTPATGNPDELEQFPTHGGADRFQQFLRDELIPWVDERFRTNEYRALAGHSLSGLFAVYALATDPESFSAYIAVSPSLWWNNEITINRLDSLLDAKSELDASLYLATGDEPLYENARRLASLLEQKAPSGFRWALEQRAGQSHNSIAPLAFFEGLEMLFDGWDVADAVFSMFEDSSIEEVEALYRETGERFGIERRVPVVMVHNFQAYLIGNDRLEDAGELMLYEPASYYLVPELLDQLLAAYAESGREEQRRDFLTRLIAARPFDATARQRLAGTNPGSGR